MPKRIREEARALKLWSQAVCAEYYCILRPMFDHFLGESPRPWKWGNTPGQPMVYLTSLRRWARRWAQELSLTPSMVRQYLWERKHLRGHIDPVLFFLSDKLLSDKEAGDE